MSASTVFTDVTAQWTEPKVTCTAGRVTGLSFMVGLGGFSPTSTAAEEAGTSSDCEAGGHPRYYAWYELVPSDSVTLALVVGPGDQVATSVKVDGTAVSIEVIDRTRKTSVSAHLSMTSPDLSSANWIANLASQCNGGPTCTQMTMSKFGSVVFSKTFAQGSPVQGGVTGQPVEGSITSKNWTAEEIALIPAAAGLDGIAPLRLAGNGTSFTLLQT